VDYDIREVETSESKKPAYAVYKKTTWVATFARENTARNFVWQLRIANRRNMRP
jgi:hypothetical protein